MNRLQKKCLVASVALHGLLAGIIVVGPAFLPHRPQPPNLPVITVIPSKLIDQAFYGGGDPNGRLPTPQPPVQQPTPPAPASEPAPVQPAPAPKAEPTPAPAETQVKPPRPAPVQPEPEPPAPKPQNRRAKEPATEAPPAESKEPTLKTTSPKSEIKVNPTIVHRKASEGTTAPKSPVRVESPTPNRADAQAQSQAVAQVRSGVSNVLDRLASNLSSGTSIEPFGPGGGGEVYANWFQVVQSIYDAAWRDPAEVTDELATVRVRVKVARDGTVLADEIVKRTGIRALDLSVQAALDAVRHLPRLPDSAKESERTFNINFNLKNKRQPG
jgi:TonB family protein